MGTMFRVLATPTTVAADLRLGTMQPAMGVTGQQHGSESLVDRCEEPGNLSYGQGELSP